VTLGWVALAGACLPSCGKYEAAALVPVRGRILLDGRPVTRGSVSLRPDDGAKSWDQPTGMIGTNGEYVVYTNGREGAPPGKYRVVVFVTETAENSGAAAHPGLPRSLVPERYNDPLRTPFRMNVTPHLSPDAYNLEVSSHDP
jgi:hypothetical protein